MTGRSEFATAAPVSVATSALLQKHPPETQISGPERRADNEYTISSVLDVVDPGLILLVNLFHSPGDDAAACSDAPAAADVNSHIRAVRENRMVDIVNISSRAPAFVEI